MECLGSSTFLGCKQLEHVELPGSLREIGEDAFKSCKALRAIKVPEGVEIIGLRAFWYCFQLEHVELPSSLREIRDRAFAYCKVLRAINIPQGLASLGGDTFIQCRQLIAAYVHQGVQLGDDVFADVSDDFVRYADIDVYNAQPVVVEVARRGIELNSKTIVRLTRQPYFRLSSSEVGVEVFPGSRAALFWIALNLNRLFGVRDHSVVIIEILKNFKWSDLEYELGRYAC